MKKIFVTGLAVCAFGMIGLAQEKPTNIEAKPMKPSTSKIEKSDRPKKTVEPVKEEDRKERNLRPAPKAVSAPKPVEKKELKVD